MHRPFILIGMFSNSPENFKFDNTFYLMYNCFIAFFQFTLNVDSFDQIIVI